MSGTVTYVLLQVILCPLSGMLTIGGAAGHIVIASLKTTANTAEVKVTGTILCASRVEN